MSNPVSGSSPADQQVCSTTGKLTRSQVAARLGVSVSKVRTMEGRALHPTVVEGVHYFAEGQVDRLAATAPPRLVGRSQLDEGRIAARVFRLIDHGKDLREIVEELEIPPQRVRTLYREWKTDFDEGEQERGRADEEAADRRRSEQLEREAHRQAKDLDRLMRQLQKG
jgi:hypothetical protein